MMKKLILTATCLTLLSLSYTKVKAEEGIAGISVVLENATLEEVKSAYNITYNWTNDRVNLREQPDINSDIIKTLDKRTKVEVLKISSSDKWVKVCWNDTFGYIYGEYLRDTELPSLDFTDEEIEMLQRITEAECTGQSIESKINVASVIINRVIHIDFPDDLESVIFQDDQFSPINDSRYYDVEITDETIRAVNKILEDGIINEALYFCNTKYMKQSKIDWFNDNLTYLFKDDSGHSFYR